MLGPFMLQQAGGRRHAEMLLHKPRVERLGLSAPGRVNLPIPFRPEAVEDKPEAGVLSALAGICRAALLVAAILRRP